METTRMGYIGYRIWGMLHGSNGGQVSRQDASNSMR